MAAADHLRLAGVVRLGLSGRGPKDAFLFDPHRLALPSWTVALGEQRDALLITLDRHLDLVPPASPQAIPDASAGLRALRRFVGAVAPTLIVLVTLQFPEALLVSAGLSFLGLGAQPPLPEWGALLTSARVYLQRAPWLVNFPGLAILVTVLGLNLLGNALRDVLDPRLR